MFTTILSTGELANHLQDPNWVIVDCRFDLKKPDWGYENYRESHIPGAVYASLDQDLAGPVTAQTGRHPLPNLETFVRKLEAWGIANHTQVIVYDTLGGAYAVRLWWMLRFLGHTHVAVLDGGFQKWLAEGRALASGVETNKAKQFTPHPDWSMVADTEEIERIYQNPAYRLIDARAPERFHGEVEPIDPIAGHIPRAVNRFHGKNLAPDGTFLPSDELKSQFKDLMEDTRPENVIVYCGSGVTSAHHLLALEIAGLPGPRLYVGSWSEWIADRKRPVVKR